MTAYASARMEQVVHERQRTERRPRRGPFDDFWPALALLLLATLIGLGALWYFTRSEEKPVPAVTGQPLDVAVSRLENEGFKTNIENRANAAPRGTVYEQRPSAGTELEEGSSVTIVASKGLPRSRSRTPSGSLSRRPETALPRQVSG